jgi:hypothetical protein
VTFPTTPLSTIAANETFVLKWSRIPTEVVWDVQLTAASAPFPAGSTVTVCPNDVGLTSK